MDVKTNFNINSISNDTAYFITTIDPRFEYIIDAFQKCLNVFFKKKFAPIWILPYFISKPFIKDKMIFFNWKSLYQKPDESLFPNPQYKTIYIPEHEDINIATITNEKISQIIDIIADVQGDVIYYPFTTSLIPSIRSDLKIIGPKSEIATKYDSKIFQRRIFNKLGIAIPNCTICNNLSEIRIQIESYSKLPIVISPEFGSGGVGVKIISKKSDISQFFHEIKYSHWNQRFIISPHINSMASPNSTGFIASGDEIFCISVSDQILHGTKYVGNIYPSSLSEKPLKEIEYQTIEIGKLLAEDGYLGYFGCDFLVTELNEIFAVDLNPRKQGGLLCNFRMHELTRAKGSDSLSTMELKQTYNEDIEVDLRHKCYEVDCPNWIQCKIKPHRQFFWIENEINKGSENNILEKGYQLLIKSFFPTGKYYEFGSYLGHIVISGTDRINLLKRMNVSMTGSLEMISGINVSNNEMGDEP